jgi:hypothetical protein
MTDAVGESLLVVLVTPSVKVRILPSQPSCATRARAHEIIFFTLQMSPTTSITPTA